MDSLIAQVKEAAHTADEAGRKKLLTALRDLQHNIEKPEDTMQRVIHLVRNASLYNLMETSPLSSARLSLTSIASCRVHCPHCGRSEAIQHFGGPLKLGELAAKTSADPVLLG